MINHIRTLLLNRPASDLSDVADAYVPSSYTVKSLGGHAAAVHAALFGNTPDRLMLNFRLYQLIKLLRVSTLAALETDTDARITYDAMLARAFPDVAGLTLITTDTRVSIIQSEVPVYGVDASGVTRHKLRLTVGSSTLTWRWLSASRADLIAAKPEPSAGTLNVTVPTGRYAVVVPDEEGTSWLFDATYLPSASPIAMETALTNTGTAVTDLILGASTGAVPPAPYDVLLDAWTSPKTPFDRVAAATIALALRTNES